MPLHQNSQHPPFHDLESNEDEKISFIYRYIADTLKYNQHLRESNTFDENGILSSNDDESDEDESKTGKQEESDEYKESGNFQSKAEDNKLRVKSRLLTKRASNEFLAIKNSTSSPQSSTVNQLERLSIADGPSSSQRTSPELPYLEKSTPSSDHSGVTRPLRKQYSDLLPLLNHNRTRRISVSNKTKRLLERSRSVDKILEYTRPPSSLSRAESPLVNDVTIPQRKTSLSAPDNYTTEKLCSHKIQQGFMNTAGRRISKEIIKKVSKEFNLSRKVSDELINQITIGFATGNKNRMNGLVNTSDNRLNLSSSSLSDEREEKQYKSHLEIQDSMTTTEDHLEVIQQNTMTSQQDTMAGVNLIRPPCEQPPKMRSRKYGTAGICKTNQTSSGTGGLQPLPPTTVKKHNPSKYTRKRRVKKKAESVIASNNNACKSVAASTARNVARRKKKLSTTNTPKILT